MDNIKNKREKVSIIIPVRNEEKFIGKCLDSIILQNYPKDRMEVLVVDGMSSDNTRKIIQDYVEKLSFIKILDNSNKFTPYAFNIGIKQAKGDIVMIIGAHACYEQDYIAKCIKYLKEYGADNVGGVLKALPSKNNVIANSIAFSLSHPFGSGNAYYRIGADSHKCVDTVFGGCYRKNIFNKIGFFNENLVRSQDWELNLRIKKAGGKIVLVPDIEIQYFPKATLRDFFKHNFKDGFWVIYPYKFVSIPFNLRHYVPLIFVLILSSAILSEIFFHILTPFIFVISLYFLTSVYFSVRIALREKKLIYLLLMPIVFFVRHTGFGLGSIWGLIKLFSPR